MSSIAKIADGTEIHAASERLVMLPGERNISILPIMY